VKAAVDKLKNKMAPDPVGIPSEMLKKGYKNTDNKICDLIVHIWNEERNPSSWVEALICPIHKKGDIKKLRNLEGFNWLMLHTGCCQSCCMED
jgi:hypothetical protein